jgi:hypothetical protein
MNLQSPANKNYKVPVSVLFPFTFVLAVNGALHIRVNVMLIDVMRVRPLLVFKMTVFFSSYRFVLPLATAPTEHLILTVLLSLL